MRSDSVVQRHGRGRPPHPPRLDHAPAVIKACVAGDPPSCRGPPSSTDQRLWMLRGRRETVNDGGDEVVPETIGKPGETYTSPSIALYLFPERFLSASDCAQEGIPSDLSPWVHPRQFSRAEISKLRLGLEILTAACWCLHRERCLSFRPYAPLSSRLRFLGHSVAHRHPGVVPVGPHPRLRVDHTGANRLAVAPRGGVEREVYEVARQMRSGTPLRKVLYRWFDQTLERLDGFQVPLGDWPLNQWVWQRWKVTIRDPYHQVLWAVEQDAIRGGYIERLPTGSGGLYTMLGAFYRRIRVNASAVVRLEERLDAVVTEWNAFRRDDPVLYGLLRTECDRVLESLDPSE